MKAEEDFVNLKQVCLKLNYKKMIVYFIHNINLYVLLLSCFDYNINPSLIKFTKTFRPFRNIAL